MSITQRHPHWYVGQLGLPHLGVSVVSTKMEHPIPVLLLRSFQPFDILTQEKGAFEPR